MSMTRIVSKYNDLYVSDVNCRFRMPRGIDENLRCYFVVNHISDPVIIECIGERLLRSGCKQCVFTGEKSRIWNEIFEDLDIRTGTQDEYIMMVSDRNVKAMSGRIAMDRRVFRDNHFLAFYDDEEAISRMLEQQAVAC